MTCQHDAGINPRCRRCPPSDLRVSLSFVLVICLTSTASSMTRFMNSSNPCSRQGQQRQMQRSRASSLTRILPSILMDNCS
jgi:hypothetical protein